MKDQEVYYVPLYIEKLIKKLFKEREKEDEMLEQINDYIRFAGYPEDVSLDQLKHIVYDNVIPGQTRMEIFD